MRGKRIERGKKKFERRMPAFFSNQKGTSQAHTISEVFRTILARVEKWEVGRLVRREGILLHPKGRSGVSHSRSPFPFFSRQDGS